MTESQKNLIYLLCVAVNALIPDKAKVRAMNLDELYSLAKFQSLRGAVCVALQMADVDDERFIQAYKKAVRKNIYLDVERAAITEAFERQGIWYMPLKGSVLKFLYNKNGLREMSDNDILFDAEKSRQVKEIMISRGYSVKSFGRWQHDQYIKPPVLNFEMHTSLFNKTKNNPIYLYYADVKRLLRKDDDNSFGYHLSDEDFYVYMTAHEWKHYSVNGTGLRSLLDCYVYCKVKGDTLDWDYITEQCRQLELADFESRRRMLALKVFSYDNLPDLTEDENDLLMSYLTAGTYGIMENDIGNQLKNQSKAGYILRQIFPDPEYMQHSVAFVRKWPVLYPVGIVYRWVRILIRDRERLRNTIAIVRKHGK